MKKFKFSLEKVLKQRQISVDLAQKDFSDAQQLYNIENEKLQEMINVKDESLLRRSSLTQTTDDCVNQVEQINVFLAGQDLRIKNQNLRLKKVENLVESRREILRQAVSEVKILERLEEKQRQQYAADVARVEQAELDELAVMRFSRNENPIKGSHEDGI